MTGQEVPFLTPRKNCNELAVITTQGKQQEQIAASVSLLINDKEEALAIDEQVLDLVYVAPSDAWFRAKCVCSLHLRFVSHPLETESNVSHTLRALTGIPQIRSLERSEPTDPCSETCACQVFKLTSCHFICEVERTLKAKHFSSSKKSECCA